MSVANAPPGDAAGAPKQKSDVFYRHWDKFTAKSSKPDKKKKRATAFPPIETDVEGHAVHHLGSNKAGQTVKENAVVSYEEAAESCKAKVTAIVEECRRLNQKYFDRMFELPNFDALQSLEASESPTSLANLGGVGSCKRIADIFDNPEFFKDGPGADDICQGSTGDCWFLAALSALSGKAELIEKLCVARDEQVGVYGFVFYRDGEWISVVVDDRLCLKRGDDVYMYPTEYMVNVPGWTDVLTDGLTPGEYYLTKLPKAQRESLRKGSTALYFASCRTPNETWLPLLEKAYAKVHGDYQAIDGGFPGEGIEDLTGGVSTYLKNEDILDRDRLWSELMCVNKDFLFGCGSRRGRDSDPQDDEGFVRGHAYTILEAREIGDLKLLKVRNPWGKTEWNGAWSDGSKEWNAEMLTKLNHTFGDDGIFWISFTDFLKYYYEIDRIRLFGPEWTVSQQWTAVNVPLGGDYLHNTKFSLTVKKTGPVVLVLSQPDERYFSGLAGRYSFNLHFRLYKDDQETYLVRSKNDSGSSRSCNAELDLEEGKYTILVKLEASRSDSSLTAEEVILRYRQDRREKLMLVGKSYDSSHSKGRLRQLEKSNVERQKDESKSKSKFVAVKGRETKRAERQKERLRRKRIADEKKRKVAEKKKLRQLERQKEKAEKQALVVEEKPSDT
ncbi:cysteine proteinase, partial [Aulographum hederae CBS 113979]